MGIGSFPSGLALLNLSAKPFKRKLRADTQVDITLDQNRCFLEWHGFPQVIFDQVGKARLQTAASSPGPANTCFFQDCSLQHSGQQKARAWMLLSFLYKCMCICVCLCLCVPVCVCVCFLSGCPHRQRPEEGAIFPGPGVTGIVRHPTWVQGTKLGGFRKAASVLTDKQSLQPCCFLTCILFTPYLYDS